jgi:hypothetical protein
MAKRDTEQGVRNPRYFVQGFQLFLTNQKAYFEIIGIKSDIGIPISVDKAVRWESPYQ